MSDILILCFISGTNEKIFGNNSGKTPIPEILLLFDSSDYSDSSDYYSIPPITANRSITDYSVE